MNFAFASLLVMTTIACADAEPNIAPAEPQRQTLCDGTAELKLRLFYPAQNGREFPGAIVITENGYPAFGVDGTCHYVMSPGWDTTTSADGKNVPWREGQFDADTQRAFEEALPLADLSTLQDCKSSAGLFDAAPQVVTTASSHAACLVPGPRFAAAWDVFQSRVDALWMNAEAMKGGLWISAVQVPDTVNGLMYDWPLPEPLTSYLVTGTASGAAHRITDADQVEKLRALRLKFLEDAKMMARHYQAALVSDGTRRAQLYMRDALPYEDEHGLVMFGQTP
jgi:hypothetical protein